MAIGSRERWKIRRLKCCSTKNSTQSSKNVNKIALNKQKTLKSSIVCPVYNLFWNKIVHRICQGDPEEDQMKCGVDADCCQQTWMKNVARRKFFTNLRRNLTMPPPLQHNAPQTYEETWQCSPLLHQCSTHLRKQNSDKCRKPWRNLGLRCRSSKKISPLMKKSARTFECWRTTHNRKGAPLLPVCNPTAKMRLLTQPLGPCACGAGWNPKNMPPPFKNNYVNAWLMQKGPPTYSMTVNIVAQNPASTRPG